LEKAGFAVLKHEEAEVQAVEEEKKEAIHTIISFPLTITIIIYQVKV